MNRAKRRDKTLPHGQAGRLDPVCDRFEDIWLAGGAPRLEDFLPQVEEADRPALLYELLALEFDYRGRRGDRPVLEDYLERFPEFQGAVALELEASSWATGFGDEPLSAVAAPLERPQGRTDLKSVPLVIGRYRIEKVLGEGGFGRVYLAHDDQLNRPVAIKVPHAQRIIRPQDAKAYLAEARILASLDHPNIVPVHDVGTTNDGLCYVVSKLIEGQNLASKIKEARPPYTQAAELVATVAAALHYAHRQGLVHRDIKPGNILLDASGKPHLADFGLALKEEDFGKGARFTGTPAYMSPEQARGEGHRVDGRSDIFSLGVVFYELLARRRPFEADSIEKLLDQISTVEALPLRQVDDTIPKELERICFKALAKRASERYLTAQDMADDLRHFLAHAAVGELLRGPDFKSGLPAFPTTPTPGSSPTALPLATPPITPVSPSSDNRPIKIVPKGLRSFDAHDADFFLELLPGPRDREGLPDSVRFWKTRIEETDPDNTYSVGLIYGPSGCGKSSLVKAGLLPRLAGHVIAVYIEATAEETETRLLNSLRKRCHALPADLGLKETLAALRRGQGIPAGKKVLIVLDQFEQWLHAKKDEENTELVPALRQCDGSRVQAIVMVRDDFWMAATRFMRELEVRLVEGQNSAAVDLFPIRHAKKVLAAFGRAFGVLPDKSSAATKEQKQFLEQAVHGLAQEGKVICARLALFAEIMKGKAWTAATLKDVGGTERVGVTFLEETFSATTAPPLHRYHQKAARAALKALLPESGTDIKGNMRSRAELLEASGYASGSRDFDGLIRMLDGEIRLITPTDPEGMEREEGGVVSGESSGSSSPLTTHPSPLTTRFYQLTHDYLVPSLRDWLTHKQKETRRGRAELRLSERASLWTAKPENRHLPAWWEWANIRLLTRKRDWTAPQRKMMRKAARYHALRGALLACVLASVTLVGLGVRDQIKEHDHANHAADLVRGLLAANITDAPAILSELEDYRAWAGPRLVEAHAQAKASGEDQRRLRASLALLPVDPGQSDYLYERLLNSATPAELPVIRDALLKHKEDLVSELRKVLAQPGKGVGEAASFARLRAACALASCDDSEATEGEPCWPVARAAVVDELLAAVQNNPSHFVPLVELLRPGRRHLIPPLEEVFHSRLRAETERAFATSILADYAAEHATLCAELLMDADAKQFGVLFPKLRDHGERALTVLDNELVKKPSLMAGEEAKETLAKRQANAAVAVLKMQGRTDSVWPLLKHSPDPRTRSCVIHRLGPLGADVRAVVGRLEKEPDVTVQRALILSLGEFADTAWPPGVRQSVQAKLREVYRTADDAGLHGASEWLLRVWQDDPWLKEINEAWAQDKEQQERKLKSITHALASRAASAPRAGQARWYVNGQGQTMVVIPGPVDFLMGSPPTETGRQGGPARKTEMQHKKRIGRPYAVAAKEVTLEQFRRFYKDFYQKDYDTYRKDYSPTPDSPVNAVTWYEAAAYCNWLSKQEGMPEDQWCYETNKEGRFAEGMKMASGYLKRTGYRLPTEAEWEYACRAEALTSRFYGESEELLGKYAWYIKNSLDRGLLPGVPGHLGVPGNCLKPNDYGLFDMLGNAAEWCQDEVADYSAGEDKENTRMIDNKNSRILRGGSFAFGSAWSALRDWLAPTARNGTVGFRAARTFTAE